jgi:HEAT repeat protein
MIILSALAALSAISIQSGTMTLAGRIVPIVYPAGTVRQIPEDVKTWDGFKGANATGADWPSPFAAPGNWSSVQAKLADLGPLDKNAPTWRAKVFLIPQTDLAFKKDGKWIQSRQRLNSAQVDATLRSLARVSQYIRAATDGAVNWAFDVEVEGDPIVFEFENPTAWLREYAASRVNRGDFVAEDKQFRGPYHAVLFLTPEIRLPSFIGPRTTAAFVGEGVDNPDGFGSEERILRALGYAVFDNWTELNVFRPQTGGVAGMWVPYWPTLFASEVWKGLAKTQDLTLAELSQLYKSGTGTGIETNPISLPESKAPASDNVSVSIVEDAERGKVLKYAETSLARYGGFSLPYSGVDLEKTPYLRFWVKSSSLDPISASIQFEGKGSFYRSHEVPAEPDGRWHEVVMDLKKNSNGAKSPGKLYLGPSVDSNLRRQVGEIVYLIDDIEFLANGQATTLVQSQPDLPTDALEIAKLSDEDILTALLNRTEPFAAGDETALIQMSKSVNARIAGEAVKKLAQLDSPTARAELLRMVSASPFEYVKQVAAIEVGKFGDPKTAGLISRLFASRSWQTRMAGARAVASLPGPEAAVISMTFLQELNPQVRLAATRAANLESPVVLKRLLWSAVNDPSDAVRAESAWKLIHSGQENESAEGYKSVRDDSVGVRLDIVSRMAAEPLAAHRGALQAAVTDLSPRVRAAALAALAKQPGPVTADEIANVFEDKFPIVQLALLELAKSKNVALPANAIQSLKASIDPRVVEKVQGLDN